MKSYLKPEFSVESLVPETSLAVDSLEYASLGERKKEEVNASVPDDWYEDLT
mgnify:CR=1 FL=1